MSVTVSPTSSSKENPPVSEAREVLLRDAAKAVQSTIMDLRHSKETDVPYGEIHRLLDFLDNPAHANALPALDAAITVVADIFIMTSQSIRGLTIKALKNLRDNADFNNLSTTILLQLTTVIVQSNDIEETGVTQLEPYFTTSP